MGDYHYDAELGWVKVVGEDVVPMTPEEIAAIPQEVRDYEEGRVAIAGGGAASSEEAIDWRENQPADTSWRKAHPALAVELDRWNGHLPEGAHKLTDFEAEQAQKYAGVGLSFDQQLNAMWHYINGDGDVSPDAAASLATARTDPGEMQGEIDKLRRQAGLPPAAAPGLNLPPEVMQLPLVQAIMAATNDPRVQLSLIAGAMVEGGGLAGPWGRGDAGAAAGPYQIHGLPPAQAEDVTRAVQFMMNEHVGGLATFPVAVAAIPDEMWQSDPLGAALLATANAERVGGWHEGLTVEEAVTIYGGRERVQAKFTEAGVVAPTSVAGAGALPTGYPQGEAASLTLSPAEYADWANLNAIYGVTESVYKAAKYYNRDALEYWFELQYEELNRDLATGGITGEDFALAVEAMQQYHLTAAEIRDAAQLGVTYDEYGRAIAAGYTAGDVRTAVQLDMPISEYLWVRDQGVSNEDLRTGRQQGFSPAEVVLQFKVDSRLAEADAQFQSDWDKVVSGYRPEVVSIEFQDYLDWRANEEYKKRRAAVERDAQSQALAEVRAGIATVTGSVPIEALGRETITYVPRTPTQPGRFEAVMPPKSAQIPSLPTSDQLIWEAARSGIVPVHLETEGKPRQKSEARTAPGGPAQVGKPGAPRLTKFGNEVFRVQASKAYQQHPEVTPTGWGQEEWRERLGQRGYPVQEPPAQETYPQARRSIRLAEPEKEPPPRPPRRRRSVRTGGGETAGGRSYAVA